MAEEPQEPPNLALLYPKWIYHRDGIRTCIVETPLQEAAKKAEEAGWMDKPNPAPPPPPPAPPLTGATEPPPTVTEPVPAPVEEEDADASDDDSKRRQHRRR